MNDDGPSEDTTRYCKDPRAHRLYEVMGIVCPCDEELTAIVGKWLEGEDPRSEAEIKALIEEWKLS